MMATMAKLATLGARLARLRLAIMDVILHVGAHRTATTSFQKVLQLNKARLADHGVAVWTPQQTRSAGFSALSHAPGDMGPQARERAQRASMAMRMEMTRLRGQGIKTLLISEENTIGTMRHNLMAGALYPELGARLGRYLPGIGVDLRQIWLGIRCPSTLWPSAIAYGITAMMPVPSVERLGMLAHSRRSWRDVITWLTKSAPQARVQAWQFETWAAENDMLIAQLLGLPDGALRPAPRQNRSKSAAELRMIVAERGEEDIAWRIPNLPEPWQPFTGAQLAMMRQRYSADLEWLSGPGRGFARLVIPDIMTEKYKGTQHDRQIGGLVQTG
jgi:hypothetical protein